MEPFLPTRAHTLVGALLQASRDLAPDELGALASRAGAAADLHDLSILQVDYSQRWLTPLPGSILLETMDINTSLAGRAFTRVAVMRDPDDPSSMWVPLVDGGNRLGVMHVRTGTGEEVEAAAGELAALIGELLVSKNQYTDLYRSSRRVRELSVAAEMQWELLPPLTCTTSWVTIAGVLEPAYDIGGDSFDYAHNGATCDLAIIDAMGHGMDAMTLSTLAIAGLRNCRRRGLTLEEAYLATGVLIEQQIGGSAFVTAQLARLDLGTGRLTWLCAGHPNPLLLRDGSVQALAARPSLPMGLGGPVVESAHVDLQPRDRLLFFSDGITEPHRPGTAAFGDERLADFLARSTLDGLEPAETLRRLAEAVLADAGGDLRDDATLLLVEFHRRRTLDDEDRAAVDLPISPVTPPDE